MNMESLEFARPRQIDLLAAEHVDAIIEHECRELATLRSRAMTASATAADLERRLVDERIDPETAGWMLVRMQRFVRDLVTEDESEALAIMATARRDAVRARLPEGLMDDQADRAIEDARATLRWTATLAPSTSSIPMSSVAPAPPAMMAAAPATADAAPEPAPRTQAPVIVALPPDSELVSAMAAAPDFWPDDVKRSRPRRFRRPSVAVTLEAAAAGAALLAVVVHFS